MALYKSVYNYWTSVQFFWHGGAVCLDIGVFIFTILSMVQSTSVLNVAVTVHKRNLSVFNTQNRGPHRFWHKATRGLNPALNTK